MNKILYQRQGYVIKNFLLGGSVITHMFESVLDFLIIQCTVDPASGGRSESVVSDITFTQIVHHFEVALFGRKLSLDLLQLIVSYQVSFLGEAVSSEKKKDVIL
jgi:hypothetical protein